MSTQDANAIVDEMFGIFGQSVEETNGVKPQEQESSGVDMFKPDPTKSEDKVWRGIVKFLPNINSKDKKTHLVRKVSYWLEDPRGKQGQGSFRFDSPKSLGKYEFCPVADKFFEWRDSDDARLKKQSSKLSYSKKCIGLVQVLVDFQNPENNGKIMPFNVPVKLQTMIDSKMYPSKADLEAGENPEQVFEPMLGPVMMLKIGMKKVENSEFRDWEQCVWHKKRMGMFIDDVLYVENEGDIKSDKIKTSVLPTNKEELKKLQIRIIETLKEAQNLQDFAYTEPTKQMLNKVNEVLAVMEGSPINTEAEKSEAKSETSEKTSETKSDDTLKAEDKKEQSDNSTSEKKDDNDSLIDDILG